MCVGYANDDAAADRLRAELPGVVTVRSDVADPAAVPAFSDAAEAEFGERMAGRVPMGRVGEPEEVAAAVLGSLSGEASCVTGAVLDVDGGL